MKIDQLPRLLQPEHDRQIFSLHLPGTVPRRAATLASARRARALAMQYSPKSRHQSIFHISALFLDNGGDLWFVDPLGPGQWDWSSAGHFREDHEFYDAYLVIERQLRQTAAVLHDSLQLRRDPA